METVNEVRVSELARDRYARTASVTIGKKQILTPAVKIRVRTFDDTNSFFHVKTNFQCSQVNMLSTRSFDASKTLVPFLKEINPMHRLAPTANGLTAKSVFDNTIIWVDPAGEYTFYDTEKIREKMIRSLEVPPSVREFIAGLMLRKKALKSDSKGWKKASEESGLRWWLDLIADNKQCEEVINYTTKVQLDCHADVGHTFVPPYFSPETLEITKKMNERSSWFSSDRKQFATVIIPAPTVFQDDDLLDDMIEYIESTTKGPVLIKPKGLDLSRARMAETRNRVRYFLNKMDIFRQKNPKRLTIATELGENAYPFAAVGFDCVGTAPNGHENENPGRSRQKKFVGWRAYYNKQQMIHIPYYRLYSSVFANTHKLPCDCQICQQVTNLDGLKQHFWNYMVAAPHYMLTWNEKMTQLSQFVNTLNTQKARDVLQLSELCNLKSLIPEF
jgi:hypothetical protein